MAVIINNPAAGNAINIERPVDGFGDNGYNFRLKWRIGPKAYGPVMTYHTPHRTRV
jgi:hypothetical protein